MYFSQKQIFDRFPWLTEKKRYFIISADYDGLICAAFLHHHLNWQLVGYYDFQSLWISKKAKQKNKDLIWVDLNILPIQGKAIGGHIINFDDDIPQGFDSSCNPNIFAKISASSFDKKFPFSTILFLLWLYKIDAPTENKALSLLLHADACWLKIQNYPKNSKEWSQILADYNWNIFIKYSNSKVFEKKMDQFIYPMLFDLDALSKKSKLTGKAIGLKSHEFQFNPDWDENIIFDIIELFANILKWSPPTLPKIIRRIDGNRNKIKLNIVKKQGLNSFIKKNKIFSYAITSPNIFNYTSFGVDKKPLLSKL